MANYDYKEDYLSQTGNWNVADLYSKIKIMFPLKDFDENRKIARFGTVELSDQLSLPKHLLDSARIKALHRMHEALQEVIDNSIFAIKFKNDKQKLEEAYKYLEKLQDDLPLAEKVIRISNESGNTVSITVNETNFLLIYRMLKKIHKDILTPLNNSDLIYTTVEEYNTEDIRKALHDKIIQGKT